MVKGNGRTKWIMYLVGVIVSLTLFIALPTIVGAIVTNDRLSRDRDDVLRKDMNEGDAKLKDCISNNQGKIIEILTRMEVQMSK